MGEMKRFQTYQIAASEALRAGADLTISKADRIEHFNEAARYAAKAFLLANENLYYRFLAICQYQCATGLKLLVESDYSSVVTAVIPPNLMQMEITAQDFIRSDN